MIKPVIFAENYKTNNVLLFKNRAKYFKHVSLTFEDNFLVQKYLATFVKYAKKFTYHSSRAAVENPFFQNVAFCKTLDILYINTFSQSNLKRCPNLVYSFINSKSSELTLMTDGICSKWIKTQGRTIKTLFLGISENALTKFLLYDALHRTRNLKTCRLELLNKTYNAYTFLAENIRALKEDINFDIQLPDWPGNNPIVLPLFKDLKDRTVFRGNIYCEELENVTKFGFAELSTVFGVNSELRNFYNQLGCFQTFHQLKDLNILLSSSQFELALLRLPVSLEILRIDLDASRSNRKIYLETNGAEEDYSQLEKLIDELEKDYDVGRFLLEIRNASLLKNFQFYITASENTKFPYEILVYAIAKNLRKVSEIFLSNECGEQTMIINPIFLTRLLPFPANIKSLGIMFEGQFFTSEFLPFCRNIRELSLTLYNSSGPGIKSFFKQLGKLSVELIDVANISSQILRVILNPKYFSELRSLDASIGHMECETIPLENQLERLFTKKQLKVFRISVNNLSTEEADRLEEFVKKLKYHPSLHYIRLVSKAVQIVRNGFYQEPHIEFSQLL